MIVQKRMMKLHSRWQPLTRQDSEKAHLRILICYENDCFNYSVLVMDPCVAMLRHQASGFKTKITEHRHHLALKHRWYMLFQFINVFVPATEFSTLFALASVSPPRILNAIVSNITRIFRLFLWRRGSTHHLVFMQTQKNMSLFTCVEWKSRSERDFRHLQSMNENNNTKINTKHFMEETLLV